MHLVKYACWSLRRDVKCDSTYEKEAAAVLSMKTTRQYFYLGSLVAFSDPQNLYTAFRISDHYGRYTRLVQFVVEFELESRAISGEKNAARD